jgi:phosphoheptose isomerase
MVDFQEFIADYYGRFAQALEAFDKAPLSGVLKVFDEVVAAGGTLWVAGNGGSAAISNHTCCDMTKGTHVEGREVVRCQSLAANVPLMTAIANDISYEDVFSRQVDYYAKPGDAVLLVSSSGNSPNVVKACQLASQRGIPTIAFVGFKGGKLKELANHCVWVPVENYGIVEDVHQSLIHSVSQYMRQRALETGKAS